MKELEKIEIATPNEGACGEYLRINALMRLLKRNQKKGYGNTKIDALMRAIDQAKEKYGNIKIFIDEDFDTDLLKIFRIVQNSRGEVYGILDEDD